MEYIMASITFYPDPAQVITMVYLASYPALVQGFNTGDLRLLQIQEVQLTTVHTTC